MATPPSLFFLFIRGKKFFLGGFWMFGRRSLDLASSFVIQPATIVAIAGEVSGADAGQVAQVRGDAGRVAAALRVRAFEFLAELAAGLFRPQSRHLVDG